MTIFQFSRVKQKQFQFDMPVWLDPCFSLLKTYIKWKPFSFFSLLNFTFTSTASYWGQIWCGHAARFLVFIAQLRVVAVYCVIFCMMKFNRLIICYKYKYVCVCEGTKQDTENDLIIVKLSQFVEMNHPKEYFCLHIFSPYIVKSVIFKYSKCSRFKANPLLQLHC